MINSALCVGCQVCDYICPVNAIAFQYDNWGTGHASVKEEICIKCGKCKAICPAINSDFNPAVQTVFAATSIKHRNTGSSGGIFYELASHIIKNGGVVYGAAFDEKLKLVHKRIDKQEDLLPLCKSKYLHSDMSGALSLLESDLKAGRNVLFVGTPCQASAVKNTFGKKYRSNLTIVDFLCHGTATQKVFDACICAEEKKKKGRIVDFKFRAKTRNAEHSFSYTLEKGSKKKVVAGYDFQFPFYYQYLRYVIFNDACYSCQYAKEQRTGDITLGDFWKIQNYNSTLHDKDGVSMLSVNTAHGLDLLDCLRDKIMLVSYPIEYAAHNNQSFREPEKYHAEKKKFVEILYNQGEESLIRNMACTTVLKNLIYAHTPERIKTIYKSMKGNV